MAKTPQPSEKLRLSESVDASNGMKALLKEPENVRQILMAYPLLERILLQAQRDLNNNKDKSDEELLRGFKGISMVDDVFRLFVHVGEALVEQERASS